MKKNDFATIALIAGFSVIVAFMMANILLGDPSEEKITIEYLDVISSDISYPDPELFNPVAINPTVETYIGGCKDDETWDDETGKCVSSTPTESDDEDVENNPELPGDSAENPSTPGE